MKCYVCGEKCPSKAHLHAHAANTGHFLAKTKICYELIVITDGEENASKRFRGRERLKQLVRHPGLGDFNITFVTPNPERADTILPTDAKHVQVVELKAGAAGMKEAFGKVKKKMKTRITETVVTELEVDGKLVKRERKTSTKLVEGAGTARPWYCALFVIDTSGSMSGSLITTAMKCVKNDLMSLLGENDFVGVVEFDSTVRPDALTLQRKKKALRTGYFNRVPRCQNRTALLDSIAMGIEQLTKLHASRKPAAKKHKHSK